MRSTGRTRTVPIVNLDRLSPAIAPLLGRLLRRTKAARRSVFEAQPPLPGRVLFLGDSITEGGAWEGWFPDLPTTNRGIGGDVIADVLDRLDTAVESPLAVSLMIGTNDLSGLGQSRDVEDIATQFRELLTRIRECAPGAPLLVTSVLPRSAYFAERITRLNASYRSIAEEAGAVWIDLWPVMAGPAGELRTELTVEGLHLNGAGYRVWVEALEPRLRDALVGAGASR